MAEVAAGTDLMTTAVTAAVARVEAAVVITRGMGVGVAVAAVEAAGDMGKGKTTGDMGKGKTTGDMGKGKTTGTDTKAIPRRIPSITRRILLRCT
jgi:hypothetical protein